MTDMSALTDLPDGLPAPVDDGACDHLHNSLIAASTLICTDGNIIDVSRCRGWLVLYCYPMTGRPDRNLPDNWDNIPGARGCTPQSCAFRDHYAGLRKFNATVYGLSTQTTEYQFEAKRRLHLPFELLSDYQLRFAQTMNLPLLNVDGITLIKRLTLIVFDSRIKKVFYPVFPPDQNATEVLDWLNQQHQ